MTPIMAMREYTINQKAEKKTHNAENKKLIGIKSKFSSKTRMLNWKNIMGQIQQSSDKYL